jgi:hypothetical protein
LTSGGTKGARESICPLKLTCPLFALPSDYIIPWY